MLKFTAPDALLLILNLRAAWGHRGGVIGMETADAGEFTEGGCGGGGNFDPDRPSKHPLFARNRPSPPTTHTVANSSAVHHHAQRPLSHPEIG